MHGIWSGYKWKTHLRVLDGWNGPQRKCRKSSRFHVLSIFQTTIPYLAQLLAKMQREQLSVLKYF